MYKGFLNNWINQDEKAQVALLSAPVTFPPVPSIALSIFQSELEAAGISSKVIYGSFPAIHLLGTDVIYQLSRYLDFQKNSEYLFAGLTDICANVPARDFIETFCCTNPSEEKEILTQQVLQCLDGAKIIVEAIVQRIIYMGARIVAASSVYSQQNASLAVLKHVKAMDPSIITILGGYNVSGEMGLSILRNFPSVDYVSFGEGDETIAELCENLLYRKEKQLTYGIVGRESTLPDTAPYRMTKNLDNVKVPQYRDFFEEIQREKAEFYGDSVVDYSYTYGKSVFLEGSRGCWWGAKHPCSFCSMNGLNNAYREKTPEKLYSEIREMTRLYPEITIQLSDNVLSRKMIRRLPELIAQGQESCSLTAEIKTNLEPDEVRVLAQAGMSKVQPGIESLNDHLLHLMNKGSSSVQNIALLKYCRTFSVDPYWSILTRVPGEQREDYEQMLEIIPLITHLNPPMRAAPIVFERFSSYGDHPEEYGLKLEPDPLYYCCFKGHTDIIDNIGVYYILTGGSFVDTIRQNSDLYRRIHEAVLKWQEQFYSENPPALTMTESLLGISIWDSRSCASDKKWLIVGLMAKIYRIAWEPVSFETIMRRLPGSEEKEIKNSLNYLIRNRLMIFLSGKYLSLAVINTK